VPDRVLRTERLVLRPLTAILASGLLSRPIAEDFPQPDDRELLQHVAVTPDELIRHSYLIEFEGELVGMLGVAGALSPQGDQEIRYGLICAARGVGLATEAVGALCAVLDREPGVRRLTAEVRPGNEVSRRLLHRLGFGEVAGASPGHLRLARAAPGQPVPGRPAVPQRIVGRHVC
jgi:RimJ/RimL family protein N-acetyltransferase